VHGKVSGKNVTVAVVDTGVEVEHEDLRARIVGHQNFIPGSAYQGEIHGTAVAGLIGAEKNERGIVGIAPDVSLLALRACRQLSKTSAAGECFTTSLARSVDAAISAKANLVNLSLGANVNDTLLGMMIDSGHEKGIVFSAPVGNDPAAETIAFPASHDKVISVAGLDEQGNPLPNRKLAAMADAVAPATHLFVTAPGNSYNFVDGTSLASAAIAGIIALSMEKNVARRPTCLPRYNSAVPWPRQVLSCLGL
jgi:subtilisin family serine protease